MSKIYTFLLLLLSVVQYSYAQQQGYRFITGTFTENTPAKGIYSLAFSENNPNSVVELLYEMKDPNFLCFSSDDKYLYAVTGRKEDAGVAAFRWNGNKLTFINKIIVGAGIEPCHVAVSQRHVAIANYGGGSVFILGRNMDGSLTDVKQKMFHTGSSIDPVRQKKPFAHQVTFSPDTNFLLVTDLGTDKVIVYKYDKNNAETPLSPFDELKLKPGSGPRHLTFSKDGKLIYLIQEMDGTLSVIGFNKGKLSLLGTNSVVRKSGIETGAADIHISPDGRFLYATNRGTAHDITCFSLRNKTKPEFVQQISVEGKWPRNFAITSDGKYVLVGNQHTNNVTLFERNKKTGKLSFTGRSFSIGAPVCLLQY